MTVASVASPLATFVRIIVIVGVPYLSVIGTLKLIWMRRVCRTTSAHTNTLSAHTRTMKAQTKQLALLVDRLNPQPPPTGKLGPRLIEKKRAAVEKIGQEAQSILLEEDSADRLQAN